MFDSFIEALQIRAVPLRHQPTLHQRRAGQLIALLGDPPTAFAFVGVGYSGYQPQIGRQLVFIREVADLANDRQQDSRAERTDALDAGQVLVSGQLSAFFFQLLVQLCNAL